MRSLHSHMEKAMERLLTWILLSEHDVILAYASMFPEMEVYLYMILPEMEVYLYMILPIKVKWLGYLDGLYLIYIFLSSGFTVAGICG